MKKALSALLVVSALATSGIAPSYANTTGTLNFTGTLNSPTCTIDDLNTSVSFERVDKETFQNARPFHAHQMKDVLFNVTGCPASVTNAAVRVTYTPTSTEGRIHLGQTDMRGGAVLISKAKKSSNFTSTDLIQNGRIANYTISNGEGLIHFYPMLMRVTSGYNAAENVEAGAFSASAVLEVTFS